MTLMKILNKRSLLIVAMILVSSWPNLTFGDCYHPFKASEGVSPGLWDSVKDFWDGLKDYIKNLSQEGDPVHLRGGEYYLDAQDISVRGRALPVVIKRRYSSRSEYNSRFGYGWDINYNIKVRKLHDPNTITLLNGENRILDYTLDPNSEPNEPRYLPPAGLYNYLAENQNGTYTLIKKDKTEFDFDINGNLSAITDRNGNSITCTYDANGLSPLNGSSEYFVGQDYGLIAMEYMLKTITDDLGREINLTYDANGLLSTITDFANRTWTYTYDSNTNDLLTITRPNTPEYPSGLTTTYTYDDKHNLLTISDANGQTWLTNNYDANDRVDTQIYGDGTYTFDYDSDSNAVTVTDRRGFNSTTVLSDTGSPLSYTVYTNNLRPNEPNSYTTSYEYNSNIEITRTTYPVGNCINYTYDSNGNVLSIFKQPDPNTNDPNITVTHTYEPKFNFIKTMTDPKGNVITYTYDYEDANYITEVGNLMKITYPTVSTPNGNASPVLSFTYNDYGQVETSTAPDGIVTKYQYYDDVNDANNYGRLWKVISDYGQDPNYLNITTEYKYDILGRVVEATDPNGATTQFTHNNLDQQTKTIEPSPYSYVTYLSYNKLNRLSRLENEISGPNQITTYAYNILDNLITTTDPLGYSTTNSYDNSENLSDVNDAESNKTHSDYDGRNLLWKVTDAKGNVTEYRYTPNGDVNEIKDPNGAITKYEYDSFDRLIKITYPDDTNEIFGYDKNSNVTSRKNRKGETIYYEYDALNRLVVKNQPGEPNITYLYDIASRVVEVNDGGDVTQYFYDRIGRLTNANDSEDRTVGYAYDDRGLRTKLIYPDNTYITYKYDALSRLRKIIDDSNTVLAEYTYDELSRRTLITLGNDTNSVYEYDIADRLKKLTINFNDTSNIVFNYEDYDKVGNRLSAKKDDANTYVYTYDEIYQLIFVDYNDGNSTGYSYDSLGNRIDVNENGNVTSYSKNSLNQYTSVGGTTYSYDDNGNLIFDGTNRYYYDSENRLIDVNDANDLPIATYIYDYEGRRVSKTVDGNTIKYCYDADQIIGEYNESGALLRKFVYGPGIDEPICMIDVADGNSIYYYHFDGLGSVVALSDVNGVVAESYSYDVFGSPTTNSSVGNPYLFASRCYDNETNLYYCRARYYNPHIGRFLQAEPVGYNDGLNLYTYCGNNPLNFVDPYGLCKEKIQSAIVNAIQDLREGFNQLLDTHPRLKKFWEGRYFGTGFGEKALHRYVHEYLAADTQAGKLWYGTLGVLSSTWQPESWRTTALVLGPTATKMAKTAITQGIAKGKIIYSNFHMVKETNRQLQEWFHHGFKYKTKNIIHYGIRESGKLGDPGGRHLGLLPSTGKNALIHLYWNRMFFSLGKVKFTLHHLESMAIYTVYYVTTKINSN
ncbi:MAG: RHS repeat-associated core domain-containing protein [Planctomycetota bacterium]|nr:MAG: RHS repeat-associated core domain-containing protein [Planctomycetota bacterium]